MRSVSLLALLSFCDAAKVKTETVAVEVSSGGEVSGLTRNSALSNDAKTFSAEENQNTFNKTTSELGGWESWCSEASGDACWSSKPSNKPACTINSGKTTCQCSDYGCNINDDPKTGTGNCEGIKTYLGKDNTKVQFCADMKKLTQWKSYLPEGKGAESKKKGWWCGSGYHSRGGKCVRRTRYLGESCWGGGWWGAGKCASGSGDYMVVCHKGKCVTKTSSLERIECECSGLVCASKNDVCNGHSCSYNKGTGKRYCDYSSGQGWKLLGLFR